MGLVEQQDAFLRDVAALLARARALGFAVSGGELYRTAEQQAIHVAAGRSRTTDSRHLDRLAIDLNFFRPDAAGRLAPCEDRATLQPLGDFWEGLDPANRWGGNWQGFADLPHFERRRDAAPARPVVETARVAAGASFRGAGLLAAAVGAAQPNRRDDVETVQRLLNLAPAPPAPPLKPDGVFGRKTLDAILACRAGVAGDEPDGVIVPDGATLRALCAGLPAGCAAPVLELILLAAAPEQVARFAGPLQACMTECGIDTPLRQAHFIAQVGHESGELRFQEEIASGAAYEGRADLGNSEPGDGRRFKGRGLIQLTGRANYAAFGAAIGRRDELLAAPEAVAAEPDLCVRCAGWFWTTRKLNAAADRDDFLAITRAINGGLNGVDHRRALLERAKALLR